jgi:hypothetical protein
MPTSTWPTSRPCSPPRAPGCRLTRDGGVPTLHIEEPGSSPNPITVVIDPGNGPGFWIDCTCIWTPPADATPEAAAGTVLAVLNAI